MEGLNAFAVIFHLEINNKIKSVIEHELGSLGEEKAYLKKPTGCT